MPGDHGTPATMRDLGTGEAVTVAVAQKVAPAIDELPPRARWAIDAWSRSRRVVGDLELAAEQDADPVTRCLRWLALHRQARSYLRHLAPSILRATAETLPEITRHQHTLERHAGRAASELTAFDAPTRAAAQSRLGIRVAVIGKGGAGKTTISSTLVRQLARRGRRVLAADLDTNPGLAISLGMAPTEAGLPLEALEERQGAAYGWQLAAGMSPLEAVERFSIPGPDGIRYLGVGKIGSADKEAAKRSLAAVLQILLGMGSPDWDIVADLEAGPTTPFEGYHAFAEDVVVVIGPSWTSAMTARRLMPMIGDRGTIIVANRFGAEPDHPGLVPRIRVPFDACVGAAEREGRSPLDACPDGRAITSIAELAELVLSKEASE